jgi:hypothetical protein
MRRLHLQLFTSDALAALAIRVSTSNRADVASCSGYSKKGILGKWHPVGHVV